MSRLGATLQRAAEWLRPRRDDVLGDWVRAVADLRGVPEAEAREGCARDLDALLDRLAQGDADAVVAEEALRAERETRRGASLLGAALDIFLPVQLEHAGFRVGRPTKGKSCCCQ